MSVLKKYKTLIFHEVKKRFINVKFLFIPQGNSFTLLDEKTEFKNDWFNKKMHYKKIWIYKYVLH